MIKNNQPRSGSPVSSSFNSLKMGHPGFCVLRLGCSRIQEKRNGPGKGEAAAGKRSYRLVSCLFVVCAAIASFHIWSLVMSSRFSFSFTTAHSSARRKPFSVASEVLGEGGGGRRPVSMAGRGRGRACEVSVCSLGASAALCLRAQGGVRGCKGRGERGEGLRVGAPAHRRRVPGTGPFGGSARSCPFVCR